MRTAAGILMIIGAIMFLVTIGSIIPMPETLDDVPLISVYGMPLVSLCSGFIGCGGVFALKRKHWKLCFFSSLLLTLALVLSLFFLPVTSTIFLLPGGILPIIFVCLRKREWES